MKVAELGRPESQADAVRADILRHATELFSHYGFNKTNIGDIATRCNMSPGNIYRYYRNKQAIGLAVVRCHFDSIEAALETGLMIPEGTHEQRIRDFIETAVKYLADECARNTKIVELAEFLIADEQGLELLQEHIAWKRVRIAREIEHGMAEGNFQHCAPEDTARALLMSCQAFWTPMTLARWRDPETIIPELRMVLDLAFRGIRSQV
ncbi:MAG: TetR/AcrR family transcriptional regulator [Pseudomonadota bacterium]